MKSTYTVKYNGCYISGTVTVKALKFQSVVSFEIRNNLVLLLKFLRGLFTGICFFFNGCRYWPLLELLNFWMTWNIFHCSIYVLWFKFFNVWYFEKGQERFPWAIVCLKPSYSKILRVTFSSHNPSLNLRISIGFQVMLVNSFHYAENLSDMSQVSKFRCQWK